MDEISFLELFVGIVLVLSTAIVFAIGIGWCERSQTRPADAMFTGMLVTLTMGLASKKCFDVPYFIDAYVFGVVLVCALLAYAVFKTSKKRDEDLPGARLLALCAQLMSLVAIFTVLGVSSFDSLGSLLCNSAIYWAILAAGVALRYIRHHTLSDVSTTIIMLVMLAAAYTALNFSYRHEASRPWLVPERQSSVIAPTTAQNLPLM